MQRQLKKSLNAVIAGCYIALTITVLMVGHLTPLQLSATTDAASVFFVVATLFALVPFYGLVRRLSLGSKGFKITTGVSGRHVMVAQAGPTSVGPVSDNAGSEIPVWAIASEHLTSCDSMNQCYPATMATTPTPKHPKSAIPQLSYDCRRKLHRAQMVVFHLYVLNMDSDEKTVQLHIPYVLSYIHDDIKAVNKELISLGLFDEAMGKKRRK
ncbi:hypothetical protein ACXJY9_002436 [Salmonella enterica]